MYAYSETKTILIRFSCQETTRFRSRPRSNEPETRVVVKEIKESFIRRFLHKRLTVGSYDVLHVLFAFTFQFVALKKRNLRLISCRSDKPLLRNSINSMFFVVFEANLFEKTTNDDITPE